MVVEEERSCKKARRVEGETERNGDKKVEPTRKIKIRCKLCLVKQWGKSVCVCVLHLGSLLERE